jgi:acyl-CoA dehydrogenase
MTVWCSTVPSGRNQGVQFPIARAFVNVEAASLMRYRACSTV